MARLVTLALLVACGGGTDVNVSPDAAAAPPMPPPSCQPPGDVCGGASCGDGVVGYCSVPLMPGHCTFVPIPEACDGDRSCEDAGFYPGGTIACTGCRGVDATACEACAPNVACTTTPTDFAPLYSAAFGQRVAVSALSETKIFDGATEVASVSVGPVANIAATSTGFVIAKWNPARLQRMDASGTLGPEYALPNEDAQYVDLATLADGRAMVVWSEVTSMSPVIWTEFRTVVAADGTVTAPATSVFERSTQAAVRVISDGASFFIANDGRVARVAPDGATTVVDGFPSDALGNRLLWSGTTRWYVGMSVSVNRFTAQAFDANGAKVGAPVDVDVGGKLVDLVADGSGFVAHRVVNDRHQLVRIAATGSLGTPVEIGAGEVKQGVLTLVGGAALAVWNRTSAVQAAHAVAP